MYSHPAILISVSEPTSAILTLTGEHDKAVPSDRSIALMVNGQLMGCGMTGGAIPDLPCFTTSQPSVKNF
jgi:hypothetical protein